MKLLVVDNVHMYKTPNGEYYTPSIYNREFFQRYLNVFSAVRLVAKTKCVQELNENEYIHVNFPNVEIYELPWFHGLREFLRQSPILIKAARKAKIGCNCIIYRVAQLESFLVFLLSLSKHPFGVEVVNDPQSWASTSDIVKKITVMMLRYMCKNADGAAYVTEKFLQQKYPCSKKKHVFTTHYSSIELDNSAIREAKNWSNDRPFRLVHVANVIDGEGKGHGTVLHCIKELTSEGTEVQIDFIGDGPGVERYQRIAEKLGILDKVSFVGRISEKQKYMDFLREHDALIFPSHSEGLPRVVIEAMACGLPCIASPVGGTPELIEDWCLVEFDDVSGYVKALNKLISNQEIYKKTSERNKKKAMQFTSDVLTTRRTKFYSYLKKLCQ